tara:strand:+ start:37 stop:186 length:150 start_codon:yes stop_codon:yes gene_type:complete
MSQRIKRKKVTSKRNFIAKALQFFTAKRFKDKTKYTRKIKHGKKTKIWA